MPQTPAEEGELDFEPQWAKPVVKWWNDIWTSPMSQEFVESDIHGLYMACVYLHESLNPYYKVAERLKNAQAWETTIAKYGLTPTARESLRWQVAQGTQAQTEPTRFAPSKRPRRERKPLRRLTRKVTSSTCTTTSDNPCSTLLIAPRGAILVSRPLGGLNESGVFFPRREHP